MKIADLIEHIWSHRRRENARILSFRIEGNIQRRRQPLWTHLNGVFESSSVQLQYSIDEKK
jgi:hypothetical protein